jgi:hypothetical protein
MVRTNFWIFVLLYSALSTNCTQSAQKEFRNEQGGLTLRFVSSSESVYRDSVYDSIKLNMVVDYYDASFAVKKELIFFRSNLIDSIVLYYRNGNIKSIRNRFYGKECFERLDYDSSGAISKYIFSDSGQSRVYVRIYDSGGKCIDTRGSFFFQPILKTNGRGIFSVNDTLDASFYAPVPPDCVTKLYTVYDNEETANIPISRTLGFKFRVKIFPLRKGDFFWPVRMKVFDQQTGELVSMPLDDTIYYKVFD